MCEFHDEIVNAKQIQTCRDQFQEIPMITHDNKENIHPY